MSYSNTIKHFAKVISNRSTWSAINPEYVARMKAQNRFLTGVDIAKYTANLMRKDMADYEIDPSNYTQSLGAWHGFIAQQIMISIKKHYGTTDKKYIYLSGWMVAAMRSEFGPLPDQSMHEKTTVPNLIQEIYTFLKQADARELTHLFRRLDTAKMEGNTNLIDQIMHKINTFETHVVPIIGDIDAGYGNEEATYLLAKKMIEAGCCSIQMENQVSDVKQCGHQDGKVTVPHEDFIAKINAVRYAFLELGVENGVIIARTDSLGAGLTQKIPVIQEEGDLAEQYNRYLDVERVENPTFLENGDTCLKMDGKLWRPRRLPNGLYKFKPNSGFDRAVLDCVTSMKNGADLLWIETPTPHVAKLKHLVDAIRKEVPTAALAYNNSPSFNWTLNFRQQIYDTMKNKGENVSAYQRSLLMSSKYDSTEIGIAADAAITSFQSESAKQAGVFHHLITLPTYHTAALSCDQLAKKYFGADGMLAYVKGVQRVEILDGVETVKHQDMAGTYLGDDHKEYFSGDLSLKAAGSGNTMSQFEAKIRSSINA